MEEHYLESAEFYNRRYSNFSVRVILPTFFLAIFIVLFSLFAEKGNHDYLCCLYRTE